MYKILIGEELKKNLEWMVFKIDESTKSVKFLDVDHHDNIYKKRFLQ